MLSEVRSVAKASKIYANAKVEELKLKVKLGSIGFFIACALVMGGISYLFAGALILFSLELPSNTTKIIAFGITVFGGLLTVAGIVALVGIRNSFKNLHKLELKEERALKISKNLIGKLGNESKLLLSPKYWFKNHPLAVIGSGITVGLLARKPVSSGAKSSIQTGEKLLFELVATAITGAVIGQIKKELTSSSKQSEEREHYIH